MTADAPAGPPQAVLLHAFVNTLDHESGADELQDAAALTAWLRAQQLIPPAEQADEEDLALALVLREGLRDAMAAHHDGAPDDLPDLRAAAAALPLRVAFAGAEPRLEPVDAGARGGLARILVAVDECRLDGTWQRLKVCPAENCAWAFYDGSKSRTRVWCAMGVCGNRTKTRAYRARRRGAS